MTPASASDTALVTEKAISTALGTKQDTITGAASTIASADLTANRVLVSDGSGKVAVSSVTSTELGYLTGATSNIQGQLNNMASLTGDNTFDGSNTFNGLQSIVYNKDSVGVGTTAFTVSATDTDAANGGTNASAATFTVNSQGVVVSGGFT